MWFSYLRRLEQLQADQTQLSTLQSSYDSTLARLHRLPHRLRPPHRVPFGPLAFFPGHLSHTNELLVLLGDNYFLECTASRAGRICQGRIDVLKGKAAKVREEEKRVRERMEAGEALLSVGDPQLNEEGEEIVEIKEEYKEEEEEEEEDEEQPTPAYAPVVRPPGTTSARSAMSDAEFDAHWDKLAELEEEEERRAQQSKGAPRAKRSAPKQPQPAEAAEAEKAEEEREVALPAIRSPADIYAHIKARKEQYQSRADTVEAGLGEQQLKKQAMQAKHAKQVSFSPQPSVALIDPVSTRPLRHHTHSPPPPAASILPHSPSSSLPSLPSAPPSSSILPPSSNPALLSAFSGAVHERAMEASTSTPPPSVAPPKKMSRFMAQRLGIPFDE